MHRTCGQSTRGFKLIRGQQDSGQQDHKDILAWKRPNPSFKPWCKIVTTLAAQSWLQEIGSLVWCLAILRVIDIEVPSEKCFICPQWKHVSSDVWMVFKSVQVTMLRHVTLILGLPLQASNTQLFFHHKRYRFSGLCLSRFPPLWITWAPLA